MSAGTIRSLKFGNRSKGIPYWQNAPSAYSKGGGRAPLSLTRRIIMTSGLKTGGTGMGPCSLVSTKCEGGDDGSCGFWAVRLD